MNSDGTHDRASLSALAQAIEENVRHEERSDTVHRLLMLSFGRVQFNYHKKLNRSLNTDDTRNVMDFYRHLPHIADWLEAAVLNNSPWLNRVDALGRPKKLMKFGTLQQIVNEVDKAMIKASQNGRGFTLDDDHEKQVAKLTDGYYLVEMLTAKALDRESLFMQHCIGNGGYDNKLGDGKHRYLSLRDRKGRPHVTIELKKVLNDGKEYSLEATPDGYFWQITQYYGKQNKKPVSKYGEIVGPYLSSCKLGIGSQLIAVPYIVDRYLNWHPIDKLPETMDVNRINYIGDGDKTKLQKLDLPVKLLQMQFLRLSHVTLDSCRIDHTDDLKSLILSNCRVGSFNEMPLSGHELSILLENVTGNNLPERIECMAIDILDCGFLIWPRAIKASEHVGIMNLRSTEPINIEAKSAIITVDTDTRFKAINHKIKVGYYSYVQSETNMENAMPKGIEAETVEISWRGKIHSIEIPGGTKVILKLIVQDLNSLSEFHIPDSIPDRVILFDNRTRQQMHVGEYRRMKRQAAA